MIKTLTLFTASIYSFTVFTHTYLARLKKNLTIIFILLFNSIRLKPLQQMLELSWDYILLQQPSNNICRLKYSFPLKQLSLAIYSRWGQKIFESEGITTGWSGTYNGIDASMDTYVWIISLTAGDGKKQTVHDTVTLIR